MDGFLQSVASGLGGLFAGALTFIGETLRGITGSLDRLLPGGLLAGVVFVVLVVAAWQLARR